MHYLILYNYIFSFTITECFKIGNNAIEVLRESLSEMISSLPKYYEPLIIIIENVSQFNLIYNGANFERFPIASGYSFDYQNMMRKAEDLMSKNSYYILPPYSAGGQMLRFDRNCKCKDIILHIILIISNSIQSSIHVT